MEAPYSSGSPPRGSLLPPDDNSLSGFQRAQKHLSTNLSPTSVIQPRAETSSNLQHIEKDLSKQTSVRILAKPSAENGKLEEAVFNGENIGELRQLTERAEFLACFVNRFICAPTSTGTPKDVKRLRLSRESLSRLTEHFDIPPNFITSILNVDVLPGFGSRQRHDQGGALTFSCWYTLHARVISSCFDEESNHALSSSGSNQLDSNSYLHVGSASSKTQQDIRSSKIGVYCRYTSESCVLICIDYQDGRLYCEAEEPYSRLKEVLTDTTLKFKSSLHPIAPHVTLLSIVARWWRQSLTQLKGQLIRFEHHLLDESLHGIDSFALEQDSNAELLSGKKSLHAIQSHLRRYRAELQETEAIAQQLKATGNIVGNMRNCVTERGRGYKTQQNEHLEIILNEIDAICSFRQELEDQVKTCLDLLGQVVRWRNDMVIVNNSKLSRKLLKFSKNQSTASQRMLRESHQLAKDTRKDSVSMKAIAILTLAFLPATSYAAILATPFFNQNKFLDDPKKVWVWIVLTVPTTFFALLVYGVFTKRALREQRQFSHGTEEEQMESIDFMLDE
ncbi:hypothetical protein F5Y03DRAFT_343226 [Xylaria venustula]|nr:hypothetical protein F5Y03DRAFT_343226 [Xylaria venustula]